MGSSLRTAQAVESCAVSACARGGVGGARGNKGGKGRELSRNTVGVKLVCAGALQCRAKRTVTRDAASSGPGTAKRLSWGFSAFAPQSAGMTEVGLPCMLLGRRTLDLPAEMQAGGGGGRPRDARARIRRPWRRQPTSESPASARRQRARPGRPCRRRRARATVAGAPRGREAVVGDPAAWTRVLAALEAVRVAARPRGARTVVVVVQPPGEPPAELPEERLGPICRQGALERRRALHNLLTLSLPPGRPPPSVPRGCARLGAGAPGRKPPFPESNVWPAGSACAPGHGVPWSWRVRPVRRQRAQSARAAAGGWRA